MPEFRDDYVLQEVDADWLAKAVKPKQCIHIVVPEAIDEAIGTEQPGTDPSDHVIFTIDDDVCTRCALCVDRCPTGVIILGKVGEPAGDGDGHQRTNAHGYAYGMRL